MVCNTQPSANQMLLKRDHEPEGTKNGLTNEGLTGQREKVFQCFPITPLTSLIESPDINRFYNIKTNILIARLT